MLQGIFGPSNQTMRRYEAECAEWQAVCDDMAAAEARALAVYAPGPCELFQYWCQTATGLCCEMPCRLGYHSACLSCAFVCCHATPPEIACDPEREIWQHHAMQIQEYWWLSRMLIENLCVRPLTPWYVYQADVGLERPPKPAPPRGDCCEDCFENCFKCGTTDICECECDFSCERLLYHVNRRLRSYLCTLSGWHACHPSQCLGPCPCIAYQAPPPPSENDEEGDAPPPSVAAQSSYKAWVRFDRNGGGTSSGGACSQCVCSYCPIETQAARHMRWDREYEQARRDRTAAFYARRSAVARGEPITAEEEAAYVKFVPTGEAAPPEAADADSHCCEKFQGRLCALGMVGTCCAGVYLGVAAVHGGALLML